MSAILPDLTNPPKTYGKPDYLESEYRIEERLHTNPDKLKLLERESGYIYKSKKTLGRLFRSIETTRLVKQWGLGDISTNGQYLKRLMATILSRMEPINSDWRRFQPYHRKLVELYYEEEQILALGHHTGGRTASLTSAEVFLGCTTLKSPYQTRKQLYDLTESLQTNYRDMVHRFLHAASRPPGAVEEVKGQLAYHFQRTQLDFDDVVDYDDDLEVQSALPSYIPDDEVRKAKELHLAMYSLFYAALEFKVQDANRKSCPWVVFPRLVAAQKNAERHFR